VRSVWLSAVLMLSACGPAASPHKPPVVSPAGLVSLPCADTGPLRPVARSFCDRGRSYMTPAAARTVAETAKVLDARFPGSILRFMDASWPSGQRPMPPHLSHGDGRELDIALLYETLDGKPLANSPSPLGYGAFEPPKLESQRACVGKRSALNDRPDPPRDRGWRLDEARSRALILALVADPRVRRIFLEPHLKTRLGLADQSKIAFAGCQAARHDDHIHVDFR
jgi:murein endopeptidase